MFLFFNDLDLNFNLVLSDFEDSSEMIELFNDCICIRFPLFFFQNPELI